MKCPRCRKTNIKKGRAMDGRRAYLCSDCNNIWTAGMQGRAKKYSSQRIGFQFAESRKKGGAA